MGDKKEPNPPMSEPTSSNTAQPFIPALPGILPPTKLDVTGNIAENWKTFKQTWENYSVIMSVNSQSEAYKVALFLHCLGPEALKIYNGLSFETPEQKATLKDIITKFEQFTIGETNETYERYVFNSRNQEPGETIDTYVTHLRTLAQTCNFCECLHDSLIRDRIVFGVNNNQSRKKLLQQRKLTLNNCIDICRSTEATASKLKTINATIATEEVHALKYNTRKPRNFKNDTNTPSKHRNTCKFCDGDHPFQKEKCPAWGQKCRNCGARNHFAKCCRKNKVHCVSQHENDPDSDSDSDPDFIGSVRIDNENVCAVDDSTFPKEIHAQMLINKKPVSFQIDCGASINILPKTFLDGHEVQPTTKTLLMWNKTQVKPIGITRLVIKNAKTGKKYSVEFVIVEKNLTPLLGAKAAQQMKLITVNKENFVSVTRQHDDSKVNQLLTVEDIVQKYPEIFEVELGSFPGEVHLEVDENVRPTVAPTRRIPTALKEKFKEELDRLEELGVIAKVDKPTPWVSSVVVATKKSGALRVCIDPKELNTALKRERYQLPVLDDILPELSQAKVYSTVDFRSGFWHCKLDEESSLLTTFATPHGRYRWCRLPFGLSVSSEIFQKRVDQVLDRLDGILDITDDVLIYGVGATEKDANEDHDRKLTELLERCKKEGVALNRDKVKLRLKEVTYMGHVFTDKGLKMDPEKAKAVQEMPRPTDVEAVHRLNGFVNYLSKFLPRLADSMEPIRRLTHKDADWVWSEDQEKAFAEVKRLVTDAPVLSYYDPKSELTIQCDASQKGLGAALLQRGKPISFISRALTETEQRYAQIEKEMLAIVFSLEKFNQYTFGRYVKIQSDHKPLEAILKKPLACAPRRLQGMMMRLQKYNIEVNYERGKNMHLADTLSRAFLQTTDHPSGADFESINATSFLPLSTDRLQEIRSATEQDETLQILKSVILRGWPQVRENLPVLTTPYFSMRDELIMQDGMIFKGQRIVIPHSLRSEMKRRLHASHLGAESCLRRARETFFWPGMSTEIREMVAACDVCRTYETSPQKENADAPRACYTTLGTDWCRPLYPKQ